MTILNYSIRKATKSDLRAVHSIEVESFSKPWRPKSFLRELKTSFSCFYVVEFQNKIIAYAIAWNIKEEIQLNKIAVRKKYRFLGIGKSLIDFIIAELMPSGAKEIHIEVREKNNEARTFYERIGFSEIGKRENYYNNDHAILMKKDLSL
jgi:ribosomal-protein-alanine N-acetyltransferase